jgi:hypothetical protein
MVKSITMSLSSKRSMKSSSPANDLQELSIQLVVKIRREKIASQAAQTPA